MGVPNIGPAHVKTGSDTVPQALALISEDPPWREGLRLGFRVSLRGSLPKIGLGCCAGLSVNAIPVVPTCVPYKLFFRSVTITDRLSLSVLKFHLSISCLESSTNTD